MTNNDLNQLRTVCGSELPDTSAPISFEYKGQVHYFCESECLKNFHKAPEHFLKTHGPTPADTISIDELD
ncbi:MAG: YHS domain-containing protein [Chloroflexota bacterium]